MFNPFIDKLDDLKDQELDDKLLELSKKYFIAMRLGKAELLTQINTAIIMYKDEQRKRYMDKNSGINGDLDQLINVD